VTAAERRAHALVAEVLSGDVLAYREPRAVADAVRAIIAYHRKKGAARDTK